MIKSSYIKISILSLILVVFAVKTNAQEALQLSLDTVVAKAIANNWQI